MKRFARFCHRIKGLWQRFTYNLWKFRVFIMWATVLVLVAGTSLWQLEGTARMKLIHDKIDLEMKGLVILSVFLAVIAYFRGKKMLDGLSTKYVGWFPDHLTEIAKIVRSAEDTIRILTDASD